MSWVIVGLVSLVSVLLIALGVTLKRIESLKTQLKRVQDAKADLDQRMADLAATVGLLVSDDPTLDDLDGMLRKGIAAANAPGGSGLSEVEQRAADRILGARAAREAGESARG